MQDFEADILREHREQLVRRVKVSLIMDHLISQKVICNERRQIILSKVTEEDQVRELIGQLEKSDHPQTFDILCEALRKPYIHLSESLRNDHANLKLAKKRQKSLQKQPAIYMPGMNDLGASSSITVKNPSALSIDEESKDLGKHSDDENITVSCHMNIEEPHLELQFPQYGHSLSNTQDSSNLKNANDSKNICDSKVLNTEMEGLTLTPVDGGQVDSLVGPASSANSTIGPMAMHCPAGSPGIDPWGKGCEMDIPDDICIPGEEPEFRVNVDGQALDSTSPDQADGDSGVRPSYYKARKETFKRTPIKNKRATYPKAKGKQHLDATSRDTEFTTTLTKSDPYSICGLHIIHGKHRKHWAGENEYYVSRLEPGSIAEKSGKIKRDDIVLEVNGMVIRDMELGKVTDLMRSASQLSLRMRRRAIDPRQSTIV